MDLILSMPSGTHEPWTDLVASYLLWTLEGGEGGKVPKTCKHEQGAQVRGMLRAVQMEKSQQHQLWQRIRVTSRGVRKAGRAEPQRPPFSFCNVTANNAGTELRDLESRLKTKNGKLQRYPSVCILHCYKTEGEFLFLCLSVGSAGAPFWTNNELGLLKEQTQTQVSCRLGSGFFLQ